ncbi:MAG TPA: M23 family metallopeptidase [Gemmatimonadaceae bacterium]|nr:M23 family metallopeptidase [Gemmatimonadaceae bacterium]
MKTPTPRAVTTVVIFALAVWALSVDLPKPWLDAPHPLEFDSLLTVAADSDSLAVTSDTLHSGETIGELLSRRGVSSQAMPLVMSAANGLDARRIPAGMPVTVRTDSAGGAPREIVFQLSSDRLLHVRRTGISTWTSREERLPWVTDTLVVSGRIDENLYQALDDSATVLPKGARAELAWTLADIFEYRVDMSRELQPGDQFRVLFERQVGAAGQTKIGRVLAARMVLSGATTETVRFDEGDGRTAYFDATGRSMRAAFLRAPLEFRRISSVFGLRKHPILGIWRQHQGTDYVANAGTPVRTIGDGVVAFAGRRGGYGNLIEIRHRSGLVTRYGHLRAFAAGIRAGRVVTIGQTIGFVGMTGLATGPHLHFELLVDGTQRDPSSALKKNAGTPLAPADRSRFDAQLSVLLASLGKAHA